ncbi:DUF1187 family protein [Succiniclasticum sp.]
MTPGGAPRCWTQWAAASNTSAECRRTSRKKKRRNTPSW